MSSKKKKYSVFSEQKRPGASQGKNERRVQ